MAQKTDLDFSYSSIDKLFRLSMGETGDFSGARYKGNFKLSLAEAQRAKHLFVADQLNIGKGSRILDMGCGWGPFLNFAVKERGAEAVGITLSEAQAFSCKKNGFNVHIKDCRCITPEDFGNFDAVVSIGAFEHFCSPEAYKKEEQETIYSTFFENVAQLLPKGGRFYLQTMVFNKKVEPEDLDVSASKDSDAFILGLMGKQFPGSWLPYKKELLEKTASPYFREVYSSSGREDYIETIRQWRKNFRRFGVKKYLLYASLLPKFLFDKEFKHRVAIFKVNPNKVCFERKLMEHYRIVFEKV